MAGLVALAGANPAAAQVKSGSVVVNSDVLDSLGPGPGAPGYGTQGYGTQGYGTAAPSTAPQSAPYPSPGSAPLVISRPGTLLFPPEQPPRSRLMVPLPSGQRAAAPAPHASGSKLPSRLLVERPAHQGTPAPRVAQSTPVARPKPPTIAQPKPVETAAPAPTATETPAPAAQAQTAPEAPEEKPVVAVAAPTPSAELTPPKPPAKPREAVPEANEPAQAAPAVPLKPAVPLQAESAPSLPPPPAQADAREEAPKAEPAQPAAAEAPSAPAPTEPAPQTAARTSGAAIAERRILFNETSADLNEAAKAELSALADALKEDPTARVQLLAYAKDRGEGSSRARRVSLSRALSVRAFLIDQGIRSTRMDVRALGDKAEGGPTERVDILPQETRQ